MNPRASILVMLAGAVVAAGCTSSIVSRGGLQARDPAWLDTGTPAKPDRPDSQPFLARDRHADRSIQPAPMGEGWTPAHAGMTKAT